MSFEEEITKNKPNHVMDALVEEEKPNLQYPVRRRKKPKFEDRYDRATFYVEKQLLEKVNQLADGEKGEKTAIINKALEKYLQSDHHEHF